MSGYYDPAIKYFWNKNSERKNLFVGNIFFCYSATHLRNIIFIFILTFKNTKVIAIKQKQNVSNKIQSQSFNFSHEKLDGLLQNCYFQK